MFNPVEIAFVDRGRKDLLKLNFFPVHNEQCFNEQFVHRFVQHANANRGKSVVLVSRPFKSTSIKIEGAPLVVRQVLNIPVTV